ncbi:MAG: DMT family transporter [Burkholderiales bacterium]|nr:DMT family transporter [Burkholderiales bacterium]
MPFTPRRLALLVALTLIWGANWPLMKYSLREIGPLWFRAITMTGGSLLLLAFYRARGLDTRLPLSTEAVTVWMMGMASGVFWLLAVSLEAVPDATRWSPGLWASLVWGVVMNYGVAQIIWFGMAREMPPTASAFSIMAVPLLGTLGAPLILGETPVWQDGVAAGCVMLAIASVLLPRRLAPPAQTPG